MRYRFAGFQFEPEEARLLHDGKPITVQPQVADLLTLFVQHPNTLFSRDEITAHLWPDVHVSDHALYQTLRKVRRALQVDAQQPYIQTVHGRGYRFVAEVRVETPHTESPTHDGFVGRVRELATVLQYLDTPGTAIAIVGPGGSGKSRLAREVARRHALPAVWVDLSDEPSRVGAVASLGDALNITTRHVHDPEAHIGERLAEHPPRLILLDNAETVGHPLVDAVARWQQHAPTMRWVLTSRQEPSSDTLSVYPLPPMAPTDAAQLFCQSAEQRGVEVPREWAADVQRIVEQLDGHALSIELAATRIGLLNAASLATRLEKTLSVLGHRNHGPARHRSLHAALHTSWEALSHDAKQVLSLLSLFPASFTADQCDAVLGRNSLDELESLMRQSWITQAHDSPGRLRLLHPIREFITTARDPTPTTSFVETMHHIAKSSQAVRQDVPNLRAAIGSCTDPDTHLCLATAAAHLLVRFGRGRQAEILLDDAPHHQASAHWKGVWWVVRAKAGENRNLVFENMQEVHAAAVAAADRGEPGLASDLYAACALAHTRAGDNATGAALGERAMHHAQVAGDLQRLVLAAHRTATPSMYSGDSAKALKAIDLGIAALRPSHTPTIRGLAYDTRAALLTRTGRLDEALQDSQRAVAAIPEEESTIQRLGFRVNLANTLQELGRFDEALAAQTQCVEEARALGVPLQVGQVLISRALTWMHLNNLPKAEADLIEAKGPDLPNGVEMLRALNHTAVYTLTDRHETAILTCRALLATATEARVVEGAALIWGLWSAHQHGNAELRDDWRKRSHELLDAGLPGLVAESLQVVHAAMDGKPVQVQPTQHTLVHLTARAVTGSS